MRLRHAVLAAPVILVLLAGCVPGEPSASSSPTPASTETPRPTPTPTPTATIVPEPDAIPLDVACDALIPAQAFYDYNPNFSLLTDYSPGAGTLAAEALNLKGVACRWINQTSGETIDISAAELTEPSLASAKADAAALGATDAFGAEGYFAAAGGVGTAEAFSGSYWVTAVSPTFTEPGDVAALVSSAVGSLG